MVVILCQIYLMNSNWRWETYAKNSKLSHKLQLELLHQSLELVASDNESILEYEKEVAINYIDAEPKFDSFSVSKDFIDFSNYVGTGRFGRCRKNMFDELEFN